MTSTSAALLGGLLAVPFFATNAVIANRIEPFFSFIRPGPHTSTFEIVLFCVVMACLPLGAFIAARPIFRRSGERGWLRYVLNGLVAAVMLTGFAVVATAVGQELYRCEVLQVPNCD